MPVCQKCKVWTEAELLLNTCAPCLTAFLQNAQKNPVQNPVGTSSRFNSIPPPPNHPSTGITRTQQRLPSQSPAAPTLVGQSTSKLVDHAGANAFSRQLVRESRVGKAKDSAPKSNKLDSKVVECALMLYQDDVLLEKKGMFRRKQLVNVLDANLYEKLSLQLWQVFSAEILQHKDINSLPKLPASQIFLSQGEAKIPNQETLTAIINNFGPQKKMQLDLMYHHQQEDNTTMITSTRLSTQATTQGHKNKAPSRLAKTWALGGDIATQPGRGSAGLSTHLARLGQPIPGSSRFDQGFWNEGKRLVFYAVARLTWTQMASTFIYPMEGQGAVTQSPTRSI